MIVIVCLLIVITVCAFKYFCKVDKSSQDESDSTNDSVSEWLVSMKLQKYTKKFKEEDYNSKELIKKLNQKEVEKMVDVIGCKEGGKANIMHDLFPTEEKINSITFSGLPDNQDENEIMGNYNAQPCTRDERTVFKKENSNTSVWWKDSDKKWCVGQEENKKVFMYAFDDNESKNPAESKNTWVFLDGEEWCSTSCIICHKNKKSITGSEDSADKTSLSADSKSENPYPSTEKVTGNAEDSSENTQPIIEW